MIFACILACCICCNQKAFDLSTYQNPYLVFGQGGGISGLRIEYVLPEDGIIYRRNMSTDSLELVKVVGRAFTKQTMQNYFSLGLDTVKCYEPGDIYYFVEYHTPENVQRIVWGKPGFTQDPAIVTYFNNLYRTAKKTDE